MSHIAPNGEIHRADIKTPTGIYIEFQHSALTDAERLSREAFYGNLAWVVDGRAFRKNFDIYHPLPDPASLLARDIVWEKAERHMNGANAGLFYRLSECRKDDPTVTKASVRGGWVHSLREIETKVNEAYKGHHQFDWIRPRRTWLDATCPIYIDFGEHYLVRMETYDESELLCVRLISKRKFVHDVMAETAVSAVARRFYPIAQHPEGAPGG